MKIKLIIILFGISCLFFPAELMEAEGSAWKELAKVGAKIGKEIGKKGPRGDRGAADDIAKRVQDKNFSSALYDRLAVLKYTLPTLNNRLEDMDILISEFLETYRQDMGFDVRNDFLPSSQLRNMNWNGNIKQLKSAVEWMVFCQNGNVDTPTSYQLPFQKGAAEENIEYLDIKREDNTCLQEMFSSTLKEARDMFEYKYLGFVLEKFDGNIAKVAAYIDMDRTALHRKLKSMNLTFETKIKAEQS